MKKIFLIIFLFLTTAILAFVFYMQAATQATYNGLPTVPCLDNTKPIVQHFSFFIRITINNTPYPISPTLGHDAGDCLHDMFVRDTSGKIYVEANDNEIFTLGQLFDEWHQSFSDKQIFSYQTNNEHKLFVRVNGNIVQNYRNIQLQNNQHIEVVYQ